MTILTGSLLSISARGTLGGALTYRRTHGTPNAFRSTPATNPNTLPQATTRAAMQLASRIWQQLPPTRRDTWIALAEGHPNTGRALMLQRNIPILRAGSTTGIHLHGGSWPLNIPPLWTVTTLAVNHRVRLTASVAPAIPGYTVFAAIASDIQHRVLGTAPWPNVFNAGDLAAPWQITIPHPSAQTWDGSVSWVLTRNSDGKPITLRAQQYSATV